MQKKLKIKLKTIQEKIWSLSEREWLTDQQVLTHFWLTSQTGNFYSWLTKELGWWKHTVLVTSCGRPTRVEVLPKAGLWPRPSGPGLHSLGLPGGSESLRPHLGALGSPRLSQTRPEVFPGCPLAFWGPNVKCPKASQEHNFQKMLSVLGPNKQSVYVTCWRSTALTVCGTVVIAAVLLRADSTMLLLVSASGWSIPAKLARWWWWWAWLYRWLLWTPRPLGTTTRSTGLRLRSLETGELR